MRGDIEPVRDVPVYMRDIKPEHQTDGFFGEGTEELIKKAKKEGKEIIVGYYLKDPRLEE